MCCSKLYYRPQRSCEGYVFTPVFHSVHRGGLPQCMLGYHPPEQTPPPDQAPTPDQAPPRADIPLPEADTPPRLGTSSGLGTHPSPLPPGAGRRLLLRTVRIILDCILVSNSYFYFSKQNILCLEEVILLVKK